MRKIAAWYANLDAYLVATDNGIIVETKPDGEGNKEQDVVPPIDLGSAPVTVFFSSREHLESNAYLYVHASNPTESGVYEFKDGTLTLKYSNLDTDWQGEYRVMFGMETVNWFKEDHSYVKLTHRIDAKSGKLYLTNNASTEKPVIISSDVSVSGIKWALTNGIYWGQCGKLNPTAPTTRALVATMFANHVTVFGN